MIPGNYMVVSNRDSNKIWMKGTGQQKENGMKLRSEWSVESIRDSQLSNFFSFPGDPVQRDSPWPDFWWRAEVECACSVNTIWTDYNTQTKDVSKLLETSLFFQLLIEKVTSWQNEMKLLFYPDYVVLFFFFSLLLSRFTINAEAISWFSDTLLLPQ